MSIVSHCCNLEIGSKMDYILDYIQGEIKKNYPNIKSTELIFINDKANKINLEKVFDDLGIEKYCCRMAIRNGYFNSGI